MPRHVTAARSGTATYIATSCREGPEMPRRVTVDKKEIVLKEWLINQIRRLSYRWPPRSRSLLTARRTQEEFEASPGTPAHLVSARISAFYECNLCELIFPRKLVSADHIDPVVDPRYGWENWDVYLSRLFCAAEQFQIICKKCHDEKTAGERTVRMRYRKIRKDEKL